MGKEAIKDAEKVLVDLMEILQIMIDSQEEKVRNMYMGELASDYVRYIDSIARKDALNSLKSYLIGRMNGKYLPISKGYKD